MLSFHLRIANPFPPKDPENGGFGRDFVCWEPRIKGTQHKAFSFQITKFPAYQLLDISLNTEWRGSDHAGPRFEIDILGLFFGIGIYDTRHWDYESDCWEGDPGTILPTSDVDVPMPPVQPPKA